MSQIIAEYKFDNILYDLIPEFNEGFEYTYEDVLEGNVTTRTIYSNELPTLLRFGNSDTSGETGDSNKYNSLLEVLYLASSEITYAGLMFHRCANVSYICPFILTNKNNSLHGIFSGCHALTSLDVSNFDTSNVTDMSYAFYTNNLIELDLSDWDTSNVTNMNHILYSCQNLKTLNISNWNLSNVNNMGWFVNQCDNLNEIIMNDSDYNSVNKIISELPITTNGSKCNFCIGGVDDISKVNIREGWDIMNQYKIAEYKFNNTVYDLIPEFNAEFTDYTYEDIVDGEVTTRTIYSDSLPTLMRFGLSAGAVNSTDSLLEINELNTSNVTDMSYMFCYCRNLTLLDASNFDTSNVTNMLGTFYDCESLTTLDLSNWDTSKVENMAWMFGVYESATDTMALTSIIGLENWDTSNVTNMESMFCHCRNLTSSNVSNFNTSNVTDMACMFRNNESLTELDVSNFDTSNVTNMQETFFNCKLLTELDLSNWDTSNVTSMYSMLWECYSLTSIGDISNWDVSNVTNMYAMFAYCNALTSIGDISNWDVSNVTNMCGMFAYCNALTSIDLSNWDVSNVTDMSYIFCDCPLLKTLKLNGWHINKNAIHNDLFSPYNYDGGKSLTSISMNNSNYNSVNKIIEQLPTRTADSIGTLNIVGIDDISQVDTATAESKFWNVDSRIKVVEYKFTNSSDLVPAFNEGFVYNYEDVIDGGVTTRIIYADSLPTMINFTGKTNLLEVYYLETSNLTSAADLFYNCTGLTYVDLRNSDFSKVESIERMFNTCTSLVAIDGLNDLDVSNVGNMGGIFSDCRKLPEINVSNWNVSKVTNFGAVFRRCYELTSIDLSNWDTSSATIMSGVFTNCSKLTEIDLSNWKMDNVTTINQMFYGCSKLTSIKSFNHINSNVNTGYLFTNCSSLNMIKLYNSDYNTVNMIIDALPTKTSANSGSLDIINVDNINQVNINTAESKYWFANIKIAEYKFDNTLYDLIPDFNTGFTYTYEDVLEGNVTTRNIYSNKLPTLMRFGSVSISNRTKSLLEINYLEVSNIVDMSAMFKGCSNLSIINTCDWNTSNVTTMNTMFDSCTSLIVVDLSNINVSNVKNLSYMFNGCTNINNLDVSGWDTANAQNIQNIFTNCRSLTEININKWNTANVTNMRGVFYGCSSLIKLDVGEWNTDKVINMEGVFQYCTNLIKLNINNWNFNVVTNMNNLLGRCDKLMTVIMNDSSYISVNKIIGQLPIRTSNSIGTLNIIGIDDYSQVDVTVAKSKYWIISGFVKQVKINDILVSNMKLNDKKIKRIHLGDTRLF